MAKRFKLKFTFPLFQMCRSKDPSSFPGNPAPAIYRLSPVNPKAHHDVGYPKLSLPPPPKSSKFMSMDKKAKSRGRKSTSSVSSKRSDWFVDNLQSHSEEESETLISCVTSFSDESHGTAKELVSTHRRKISSVRKVQRLRFHTLENRSGSETGQVKKKSVAAAKKSKDSHEDFKKSMLEMIMEMEMSETEDLEQLLQCFLALNSPNYHEVIVRAFMEIWQQMFVWNPRQFPQTDVRIDLEE